MNKTEVIALRCVLLWILIEVFLVLMLVVQIVDVESVLSSTSWFHIFSKVLVTIYILGWVFALACMVLLGALTSHIRVPGFKPLVLSAFNCLLMVPRDSRWQCKLLGPHFRLQVDWLFGYWLQSCSLYLWEFSFSVCLSLCLSNK